MAVFFTFFNSSFFVALVTLLAATAAYFLYRKQNRDAKRDFANIILLEIQNAERVLDQVRDPVRQGTVPNRVLLRGKSWAAHSHRFVRDFDRDEWDAIGSFYDNCERYDAAVLYNASFFEKNEEQNRINLLRITAEAIYDHTSAFDGKADAASEAQAFSRLIAKMTKFHQTLIGNPTTVNLVQYAPKKPINDAQAALSSMTERLTLTTIGTKLRALAGRVDG